MTQSRQPTSSDAARSGATGSQPDKPRASSAQQASSRAGESDAAKQAGDVATQVQDQAGQLVGQAKQQATTQLASQKKRAASTLGTLASALHEASRQVREQDDAAMAGYIDSAAGQLDSLVDTLNQQDIGQIIDSAGRYARRQPAVFLAGAIAVGFLGARFLKSSSPSSGRSGGWSGERMAADRYGDYGSAHGSMASGVGSDLGYGTMGAGDGSGYAASATGAGGGGNWQARSAFDAGPEGQ